MSSPAVHAGPPNSHFHNTGGGRPVDSRNGHVQEGEGGKRPDKIFRHIKDLVAVRPDIDINAPIRKILLEADQHAKNADSLFDFRRPDLALEQYLLASIVAVEIIPRHKDYPQLQSDRGELHRLYQGLKKRIHSQQDRFAGAKDMIKENNIQHGTQPANNGHPNPVSHQTDAVRAQSNSFDTAGDKDRPPSHISFAGSNGLGNSATETGKLPSINELQPSINSNISKRPAVHPKPQALQGKSIRSKDDPNEGSTQSAEDLTSRFARLRGAEAVARDQASSSKIAPVQDPRIKTRPIVVPNSGPIKFPSDYSAQSHSRGLSLPSRPNRPIGPRDLSSGPSKPLKIALGVEIPSMPRAPEPVYSPARNLEDNSHGDHLVNHSKVFNNYISRTSSIDSTMDLGRNLTSVDDSNPYFYDAVLDRETSSKGPRLPDLSRLRNITAQQLQKFMQIGSQNLSILLVDIRPREDFDNGHIMWVSIICVDPISLRPDISADELEQSMVISPDAEHQLYMQRNKYSLVVYYDQSTSSSSTSPGNGNGTALQDFRKAVYDYGYEKRLQNKPLLLEGGLDAWIDLVGEGALATSKSSLATKTSATNGKSLRPRNGMHSATTGNEQYNDNTGVYERLSTGSGVRRDDWTDDYFKTAEDFMRRFPAASDIKESMMSPSSQLILASKVPAKPQKAITPGGSQPQMFSRLNSTTTATNFEAPWGPGRTGLFNRGNLCYMNAAIQALSSIHELRDYLFRGSWVKIKPSKGVLQNGVNINDQQLATKTFTNLLMHLWSADAASCSHINPRTFVATMNRLHINQGGETDKNALFGGPNQQDSDEFIQFLLQKLREETSPFKLEEENGSDEYGNWIDTHTDISVAGMDVYNRRKPEDLSPIAKLTATMCITDNTCTACNKQIRIPDGGISHAAMAYFPEQQYDSFAIEDLLLYPRKEDLLDSFSCKYCKRSGTVRRNNNFFIRLPNILIIRLTRERSKKINGIDAEGKEVVVSAHLEKINWAVSFPENNMDLAGFLVPGQYGPGSMKSTKYDCFAVVCHLGNSLRSGHYTTYRRDMTMEGTEWKYKEWWLYNDTETRKARFDEIRHEQDYILFYRLQGTH